MMKAGISSSKASDVAGKHCGHSPFCTTDFYYTSIDKRFVHIFFIPCRRIVFVRVTLFERNVFFDVHTQGTKEILRIESVQKLQMPKWELARLCDHKIWVDLVSLA